MAEYNSRVPSTDFAAKANHHAPKGCAAPLIALLTTACGAPDPLEEVGSLALPLAAECAATVIDVGEVPIESDYLPRVVACENGDAPAAALRAQAISARSYLYYALGREGSISDGTSDQVYSCSRPVEDQHFEAVEATTGTILGYRESLVAAFYVAGAKPSASNCRAREGDPDNSNTERFVTYNAGLSGDEVFQTSLGFIDPQNLANRGCASQNGAACLAEDGQTHEDILRFYYGEDIEFIQLEGCGTDQGRRTSEAPGSGLGCRHVQTTSSSSSWLTSLALVAAFYFRRRSGRVEKR